MSERIAFSFDRPPDVPDAERLALLGGKGKSLADMIGMMGLPVPPGFTLTTAACRAYLENGWSDALERQIERNLADTEAALGRAFGDSNNPLLLSVRSGGAASMPGMMDTILNVGLEEASAPGFAAANGGDRDFAENCLDRLRDSFAKTVGRDPPRDARAQLREAVEAVFKSWNSDRAIAYRRIEKIADDAGTAINIQAMVFGNRDENSGTGVVFSRNPSTGERSLFGDILFQAQGEDVVAGTHETMDIAALRDRLPAVAAELDRCMVTIERHYRDLVDVEFTIEAGRLWILQARPGKRSPAAAIRIAHDMAEDADFPFDRAEALDRVRPLLHSATVEEAAEHGLALLGAAIGASPGIASGKLATSTVEAVRLAEAGEPVILARPETSPEDIEGIAAAKGLLTAKGGLASHAAVVARGWGKPAVVGWRAMRVSADGIAFDGRSIPNGELIAVDGRSGEIFLGALESRSTAMPEAVEMLTWAQPQTVQAVSARSLGDDELVLLIGLKGFCTRDAAGEVAALDTSALAERLDALADDIDASSPRFLKLTDTGEARLRAIIEIRASALGFVGAKTVLDSFHGLNDSFKSLVTDWQMQPSGGGPPVFNDHGDAAYDAAVLERLADLHRDAGAWLAALPAAAVPRLFAHRFERAHGRVSAGDTAYLASPKCDSYHNIWFELHEFLIRLAGLTRAEAEAATHEP